MSALTNERATSRQDGEIIVVPVETATKIFAGGMVAVNAAGNAVPAADADGLKVVGCAEETVDNQGAAGDLAVQIRRKKAFWFTNDGTNPVTAAHLFGIGTIYVVDDQTVSSDDQTEAIVAGKGLALDVMRGVLVEIQ